MKLETKRPISPGAEELIGHKFPVLDHGHIVLMDYMGNDSSIVQAARTSYQAGTKTVNTDKGLIAYLRSHRHSTPFEMCELKLHVRMPIFVARQWIRHRTANVNEQSARYSILPNLFYIPEPEHCAVQSTTNKQGRGEVLSQEKAEQYRANLRERCLRSYAEYEHDLGKRIEGSVEVDVEDGLGLARETARMGLHLNFYTEWVWKCDLHNLFHFLGLRADSHAQYEIRVYAEIILHQIVKAWVPWAYEAFIEHQYEAVTFNRTEMEVLRMWLNEADTGCFYGMTEKKFAEFKKKLGVK